MKKLGTLAALVLAFLLVGIAPAFAAGNDYPYANAGTGATDPWGMTERECTSFVAWRSHQAGHNIPGTTGGYGAWAADRWDDNAALLHKKVDHTATVDRPRCDGHRRRVPLTPAGGTTWRHADTSHRSTRTRR